MTADPFPHLPEPGKTPATKLETSHRPPYDWRNAGTIFGAVFVALSGIFAILEFSGSRSDKVLDNVYYRFDLVDQRFNQVSDQFRQVNEQFKHVNDQFEHVKDQLRLVDQRFALVDQRFDKIDARLDRMDQRFDRIDKRLDKMDVRFDKLEAKIDTRFDRLTDALLTIMEDKSASAQQPAPATRSNRSR